MRINSDGSLTYHDGASSAERFRVTKDGNVGIGTNTPSYKLHVTGDHNYGAIYGDNNYGPHNAIVGVSRSIYGSGVVGKHEDGGIGVFGSSTGAHSIGVEGVGHDVSGGGVFGFSDDGDAIYGQSGNGFAGYFDGKVYVNGRVGIGTQSPAYRLDVADRMRVRQGGSPSAGIYFYQSGPADDQALVGMQNNTHVGFYGNTGAGWALIMNTTTGDVTISGNVCAANISCASDAGLKQNVRSLKHGLSHLMRLRPVSWQWKDPTMKQLALGLIAQEVETVNNRTPIWKRASHGLSRCCGKVDHVEPLLTFRNRQSENKGVRYNQLNAVLISAIKEQQQLAAQQTQSEGLKSIKAENAELKAQLADISARLQSIEKSKADHR